jgi:hypothetical protein
MLACSLLFLRIDWPQVLDALATLPMLPVTEFFLLELLRTSAGVLRHGHTPCFQVSAAGAPAITYE